MLRIIEVDQKQMLASQQFFALEAWGDAVAAFT